MKTGQSKIIIDPYSESYIIQNKTRKYFVQYNISKSEASTLKMGAVCSSETLISAYKITWCRKPYDLNLNSPRLENLETYLVSEAVP
jgi:hypothetical protein